MMKVSQQSSKRWTKACSTLKQSNVTPSLGGVLPAALTRQLLRSRGLMPLSARSPCLPRPLRVRAERCSQMASAHGHSSTVGTVGQMVDAAASRWQSTRRRMPRKPRAAQRMHTLTATKIRGATWDALTISPSARLCRSRTMQSSTLHGTKSLTARSHLSTQAKGKARAKAHRPTASGAAARAKAAVLLLHLVEASPKLGARAVAVRVFAGSPRV